MDPSKIQIELPKEEGLNPHEFVCFRAEAGSDEAAYLKKLMPALVSRRANLLLEENRLVFHWPDHKDNPRVVLVVSPKQIARMVANQNERLSRGTQYEITEDEAGFRIGCCEPLLVHVDSFRS